MHAGGVDQVVRLLAFAPWAAIPVLLIFGELADWLRRKQRQRDRQRRLP